MSAKMVRLLLASAMIATVCVGLVGCSPAKRTASQLHGVWYEDKTGAPYDFISDTQLVLPTPLSNGSNAVAYSVIDGDKISMTQSDVIHVINITKLDDTELDTHDPASATDNKYFRNVEDTAWGKNRAVIANDALIAIKNFPNLTPKPQIVWASAEPTNSADVWKKWPTSSMARYAKAWSWSDITRNEAVSLVTSGTTGAQGFAVDFNRTVPTQQQLASFETSDSKVSAGSQYIAVGYSDSMSQYPAGTFIYLNSNLLYSLGAGFAINVQVGPTLADGFAPGTHN